MDAIPLMGLQTRIDKALRLSQKRMFAAGNGGRKDVPKVLILLTDGSQTKSRRAEDPSLIAEELRRSGITLLVVGIGSATKEAELNRIAGSPDKVFSAESFDKLMEEEFITGLTGTYCTFGMF